MGARPKPELEKDPTFLLAESAPYAVRLADRDRVATALRHYWAGDANLFCLLLASELLSLALGRGRREEDRSQWAATCRMLLPEEPSGYFR